jgi:hypothetical protein
LEEAAASGEAERMYPTFAVSCRTGGGVAEFLQALQVSISCTII